jgi:GH24 family phage-related lysozyme (muramidase)
LDEQYKYAAELLRAYEGFNPTAVWDVAAWRIGYGSGTITFSDGTYRTTKPGDKTTIANATKDLTRRTREFEKKLIRKIGADFWEPLNYKVKAALISYAYNYGNIIHSKLIDAIKKGDNILIADTLIKATYNDNKKLSENIRQALRKRRAKEAKIIREAPQPKKKRTFKLIAVPLILFGAYYLIKNK